MENNISLTVRFPQELYNQLTEVARRTGMTRPNLLRYYIHHFLLIMPTQLVFSSSRADEKTRFVFKINQATYNLLLDASKEYNKSINQIIVAVGVLLLDDAARQLSPKAR